MNKIKVCVVDDNRELVNLLEDYIDSQEDMEVVGISHNGQDCLEMLENMIQTFLFLILLCRI